MHSKAMLVQNFTNLVCIWHKRDRTHLFAIVMCFSLIFRFLKLKLDLEMAAPLKARKSKIMATVFLDSQDVILVDFLPKGETTISEVYRLRLLESSKQKFDVFGPTWTWQMCSSSMTMHVLTQASGPWRPSLHLDGL